MNVKKEVIINFLDKNYEIKSWNEQGEITKIEGMLTIAFLVISPCSHIDERKMLYLIIKIPYMVDMSANKYVDEKNKVKVVKYAEPMFTPELYHQQNEKIKELSLKIDKLGSEIEKLKSENHQLKILCGKADRGWRKELDWVYYYEPDTGEPIGYDCPTYFTYDKVESVRYYLKDGEEWCKFWYKGRFKPYEMPRDAFLWLQNKLPKQKKIKTKKSKIQKLEFKEKDDIIEYLENYFIDSDKNISQLEYLEKAVDFLWDFKDKKDRDKKFGTADFRSYMKVGSEATIDSYLDMFDDSHVIIRPHRGLFWINF